VTLDIASRQLQQETLLFQRDSVTHLVTWNPVNWWTTIWEKSHLKGDCNSWL